MPASPQAISAVVAAYAGSGTHLVACDTCALLDIIRFPQCTRAESLTTLGATIAAVNTFLQLVTTGQVAILCPDFVEHEWKKHAIEIKDESTRALEGNESDYQLCVEIAKHAGISFPSVSFDAKKIAQHYFDLSEKLLASSILLKEETGPLLRATRRAAIYTPPARKGAIQDCMIYEHVLEFFSALAALMPHAGKNVFLTSNVNDYCDSSHQPKNPIYGELTTLNVSFCTRWNWALSVIMKP